MPSTRSALESHAIVPLVPVQALRRLLITPDWALQSAAVSATKNVPAVSFAHVSLPVNSAVVVGELVCVVVCVEDCVDVGDVVGDTVAVVVLVALVVAVEVAVEDLLVVGVDDWVVVVVAVDVIDVVAVVVGVDVIVDSWHVAKVPSWCDDMALFRMATIAPHALAEPPARNPPNSHFRRLVTVPRV